MKYYISITELKILIHEMLKNIIKNKLVFLLGSFLSDKDRTISSFLDEAVIS